LLNELNDGGHGSDLHGVITRHRDKNTRL